MKAGQELQLLFLFAGLSAVLCAPVLANEAPPDQHEDDAMVVVPELARRIAGNADDVDDSPIIGGQGNYRFQYDPTRVVMPDGALSENSHGLVLDDDNNIILTYQPKAPDTHCLVKWAPDGTGGTIIQTETSTCTGTPHGLRLNHEDGQQVLYHANNNAVLHKTHLDGSVIWTVEGPPGNNSKFEPYKPTWFATPPGSDHVYMSDGYGSNFIHVFQSDGTYTGHSFGGRGTDPGQFQTCHSINHDPRNGRLVVTDRENHRHQYFDWDPEDPSVFDVSSIFSIMSLQRPCNIRFQGDHAIVPALEGPVGILDKTNDLVSLINVTHLLGDKGHLHPHDALLLPNGDMVVATWAPGRISYWKRLPNNLTEQW